ncbi:hypothetical protein BD770DRAFT_447719 [Pilaira anomala]|nr:hypothetical protein BD770DRAFT_447719 [Pilaira anomala]
MLAITNSNELTSNGLVKYLKTETDNIVQTIQNLVAELRGATATVIAKRDLAKETYEIAKFTKELIVLFDSNN